MMEGIRREETMTLNQLVYFRQLAHTHITAMRLSGCLSLSLLSAALLPNWRMSWTLNCLPAKGETWC